MSLWNWLILVKGILQKTNRMENYIEGTGKKNYIFYLKNRENNETEYFLINKKC